MRRRRFAEAVEAITNARLGYQAFMLDDVIAVRYGHRWSRLEDVAYFVEEARRGSNIHPPHIPPSPAPSDADLEGLFWSRPEIEVCVSLLRLTRQYEFSRASDAIPLIELTRDGDVYRDTLLRAVARSIGRGMHSVQYLYNMSDFFKKKNPVGARIIRRLARNASVIFPDTRWSYYYYAYDTLIEALDVSGYFERLEKSDPEAAERIRYLIDLIPKGAQLEEAIRLFEKLARDELAERLRHLPAYKAVEQRLVDTIPF
jgi:hypothetical protein